MNSIQRGKPRVELGDVRLSLHGKDADPRRAERIARLLLAYLGELIEREQLHVGGDTEIPLLVVPPLAVPEGVESEEAVARAGAENVYRALVQTLAG